MPPRSCMCLSALCKIGACAAAGRNMSEFPPAPFDIAAAISWTGSKRIGAPIPRRVIRRRDEHEFSPCGPGRDARCFGAGKAPTEGRGHSAPLSLCPHAKHPWKGAAESVTALPGPKTLTGPRAERTEHDKARIQTIGENPLGGPGSTPLGIYLDVMERR